MNTQCYSGVCEGESLAKTCTGNKITESCNTSKDCGIGTTCQPSGTFQKTTCQAVKTTGARCEADSDCAPASFCWYPAVADIHYGKKCMVKLALADGATFGWRKLTEREDGSNMIRNGLACQSGTARWTTGNTGTCFTIDHIESDGYDNDPTPLTSPYPCAAAGEQAKCRYYVDLEVYVSGKCQCGLDGTSGYCQYPAAEEITQYYTDIKPLWEEDFSKCHNQDVHDMNFLALAECTTATMDDTKLKNYAQKHFEFQYWAMMQGETAKACMNKYHPESGAYVSTKQAKYVVGDMHKIGEAILATGAMALLLSFF